jgi:hypothetical protein
MRILFISILSAVLLAVIPLAIFYPDSHQVIIVFSSIFLVIKLAFIICRGAYRMIRQGFARRDNFPPRESLDSDLAIISAYTLNAMGYLLQSRRSENRIYPTIIGLFIEEQSKHNSIAYFALIISSIIYIGFSLIYGLEVNIGIILIFVFFLLILHVNESILAFRIMRGFYGTNEYEAREILQFITSHAGTSNFRTGQGLKDIFPVLAPEEAHGPESVPGAEGAQA